MADRDEALSSPRINRRTALGLAAGAAAFAPASKGSVVARPTELVMMDASTLSSAIHARKVSCVEVMTAYLDHIERVNPKFNAIVALQERAQLLNQAGERDRQLARGESAGPLHGFPHAAKDLQPVKGLRTTLGSPIFRDWIPPTDALMVERLRRAGVIFIGKTNTPEFGLGSHTYNPVYGVTRNAYDPSRSAGGSSGGAAVALALRMLPLADGSDYGGSLRNPAGWNNVFGFRTSFGLVPAEAHDAWLPSMGVTGPMARNVTDLALLLSVQAGFDERAPLSLEGTGARFQQRLETSLKGRRIAWGADFKGFMPCEPGVLEVCRGALQAFETLGCSVDEAVPDFDLEALWQSAIRLRAWQMGAALRPHARDPAQRALLKPEALYEYETGAKLSAYDISEASELRTRWYEAMRQFFGRYDYLVVPTAQVFPFDVQLHWPREIAGHPMQTYHEWMKVALLVTMSGCPALAAPAGFSAHGLPMGIQIIGPHRHELECLQLAYAYELATQPARARLPDAIART